MALNRHADEQSKAVLAKALSFAGTSKLEPAGIKIRTVRGFGYMLEEFKEP